VSEEADTLKMMTIHEYSEEEGDCILWRHATTNGHPVFRVEGKTMLVRRWLWVQANGPIKRNRMIMTTCNDKLCVNPEHLKITTYSQFALSLGPSIMGGPVRSAAIAKAKQNGPTASLNWDLVREIRSSDERGSVISRRLSVSHTQVTRVRNNLAWKEHSPWDALLRMAA
jgi:hypothetical protein